MSSLRTTWRIRCCGAAVTALSLWLSGTPAAAERLPALGFEEALRLAEQQAPALRAAAAALEAARHEIDPAAALPDPEAFIGVNALPVEGSQRFEFGAEPMTMQTIGVRQAVPNGAKRSARRGLAVTAVARTRTEHDVVLARVRRETAVAWMALFHAERGLALFDAWQAQSRLLIDAATARIESGRSRASDVLVAQREALAVEELRDRQVARVAAARAGLRAWIADAAERELTQRPPDLDVDAGRLQRRLREHPELELYGSLAAQARARVDAAAAEKRPDWELELGYQRRPGFDDMVALQVKVDLPLFPQRRQDPLIEAERRRALQIDAERAAAQREHAAVLEAGLAEHRRLQREERRLVQRTLPLMTQLVDQRLAEYRGGQGNLDDVVRARLALLETRLELVDAQSARGELAARLRYSYLEEQP